MKQLRLLLIPVLLGAFLVSCETGPANGRQNQGEEVRDVSWFLKRMRTLDHLPLIDDSHTALVSTWDTTGANLDAFTHDRMIDGNTNTILDIDGPGCIHRIFTGFIDERFDSTRIQIYLDHSDIPLFDMPITEFFDDRYSPFYYPLVFVKSYPGTLMPIPFEKNIRIRVVNNLYGTDQWIRGMWGIYWQFTYTKYRDDVKVRSLHWPLNDDEKAELDKTCQAWLNAESGPPSPPTQWSRHEKAALNPGESLEINLENTGIIEQMRISAWPDSPEVLNKLRLKMFWDGCDLPGVDVPFGFMFGHGQTGHNKNDSSIAAVMGKYVGSMLQVDWPFESWWGEGDWLFWTDENTWPPSYHGTGSEEYFNSGWGMFDRKAVSGFVSLRPVYPTVYSFHLNDAFCFQENITVAEEQWALTDNLSELNPMWSSVAFWYATASTSAESQNQ